jgi:hypothetical protein
MCSHDGAYRSDRDIMMTHRHWHATVTGTVPHVRTTG